MKHFHLHKGLDIPIAGAPKQSIRPGAPVSRVALIGDDAIGMKPTMEVQEGETVKTGQLLFTDKKNPGVCYTAPGCGTILSINRGAKRKFESLIIQLEGDDSLCFLADPGQPPETYSPKQIRAALIESGLWTAFRTRPYGKIPAIDTAPTALFVTATDSHPLAPSPAVIISRLSDDFQRGLQLLRTLFDGPIHYCTGTKQLRQEEEVAGITYWSFMGPHPAGLPSTHIHFINPADEHNMVWHIGYQDVIAFGHLFRTGQLLTERIIALAGPGVTNPSLIKTRIGAALADICHNELVAHQPVRILSGSILSGRQDSALTGFLGRYHNQVSVLFENSGRSFMNWAMPGGDRFSVRPVFLSALAKKLRLPMNTATWGGKRAIYPLGTYEQVMPLDIIATYLLRAIAVGHTEKARALGCLELIEEDIDLLSFVCPGKNDFGPMLREVLTAIELEG